MASPAVVPGKLRIPQFETLPRERLDAMLASVWRYRLGLVVAPAGSGKTSLLAGFARSGNVPVAWYRAESWDGDEVVLVRHLERGLSAALGEGVRADWTSVEDAILALEALPARPALIVVDDLHALEGTEAEQALERFIGYCPPWLAVLAATRVQPAFNLSRLRVSGGLLEIGPDDLRFRSWEVERLFRDFYGERVPPQELAILARRTEGWAAGLQLFHLATRGKSPEERRQLLAAAGRSSRLVREYLTRNVLDDLPAGVRSFLLESSVLGRLSGRLCDELLGRSGSRAMLEDLERRGVFTVPLDEDEGTYRYHEVLRSHLEWILVEGLGEEAVRQRYRRAGDVLEAAGWHADAIGAYCRAEDWAAAHRLLGRAGEQIVDQAGDWLERLPPAIVRHDPWLVLASARRARAEGRWAAAVDAYQRAESALGPAPIASICRAERLAIQAWLQPDPATGRDWSGIVRGAVSRDPLAAARDARRLADGERDLAAGLAALLAGNVREARSTLLEAAEHPSLGAALAAGARLAAGVATLLSGDRSGFAVAARAVEEAELGGATWLARIGTLVGLLDDAGAAPTSVRGERVTLGGDAWGNALEVLARALGPGDADDRLAAADSAVAAFRALGAGVLEAWARSASARALAELGSPDSREAAAGAEAAARATGTPGARLVAYLALAAADPDRRAEYEALAAAVGDETGYSGRVAEASTHRSAGARPPVETIGDAVPDGLGDSGEIAVRCFGAFDISVGGVPLDLAAVKPRARALLRFLALHAGATVHREVIQEALWPEVEQGVAARSLQVGISTLRGLLEPGAARGGGRVLLRAGDGYRFSVGPDGSVDLLEFDAAVAAGRSAQSRGDLAGAAGSFQRAIDLHRGDLLAEDGPSDWVIQRREACRSRAVEAAEALAEIALLLGDPEAAARACRAGLSIDRYHDPLWRLLIESRQQAGDAGAALRARREYEGVLATLGLEGSPVEDRAGSLLVG